MTPAVLAALDAARRERGLAVLCTRLGDGRQVLLREMGGALRLEQGADAAAELVEAAERTARGERGAAVVALADGEWFVHPHPPAPRLLVVGAVHIAQLLAPMARMAGLEPVVIDPREALATPEQFPGEALAVEWPDEALRRLGVDRHCAVVALCHDPKLDDPGLEAALRGSAFYVGALGGAKTQRGRRERLLAAGLDAATVARLRGPVGLPIGASGAAEIAVSILAEIVAVRRGGRLAHRDRWPA